MDILELINILKNKFTKKRFFVRIYHIQDNIVIYNDADITLRYNRDLFDNIDKMVNQIIKDVKKKNRRKIQCYK